MDKGKRQEGQGEYHRKTAANPGSAPAAELVQAALSLLLLRGASLKTRHLSGDKHMVRIMVFSPTTCDMYVDGKFIKTEDARNPKLPPSWEPKKSDPTPPPPSWEPKKRGPTPPPRQNALA